MFVIAVSALLSGARILALFKYYHAPFDVSHHLERVEIPRLLNATGLLPPPRPLPKDNSAYEEDRYVDLSAAKQIGLRVCYGKEWYRFPSHYMFPEGVEVQFVKSGFSGHLPQHFAVGAISSESLWRSSGTRIVPPGLNDLNQEVPGVYVSETVTNNDDVFSARMAHQFV